MKLSLALMLLLAPDVTREVYLMGTRCVLSIHSPDRQTGEAQLEKYIRIIEDTENELSVWLPATELSRLNAQPLREAFLLDSKTFALFEELFSWTAMTEGAFDPAIGRLLHAWGLYGNPRVPSAAEISEASRYSGIQHFSLHKDTHEISRLSDARIDSGAFGKGEALDRVFRQAVLDKSSPWLIDFGGQVMVYGVPPGQNDWPVDIAHPLQRDKTALTIALPSGSIATSAQSERAGHILDPRTGKPASFKGSVTVWHERALIADILSTALFVMGPDRGLEWAESRGLAACFLIPREGEPEIRVTTNFGRFL